MKDYKQYGVWLEAIHKQCAGTSNWKVIDDWCYSSKVGLGVEPKLYHLCKASHRRYVENETDPDTEQITLMKYTHCVSCSEDVPEGLKMIVMLLESNI